MRQRRNGGTDLPLGRQRSCQAVGTGASVGDAQWTIRDLLQVTATVQQQVQQVAEAAERPRSMTLIFEFVSCNFCSIPLMKGPPPQQIPEAVSVVAELVGAY